MRERDRQTDRQRQRETERGRWRQIVRARKIVRVCERETETREIKTETQTER